MSGDVQPRKRKDKKKKKDETDGYLASNEDLNIHVHKEGGTGGNICAKIVFFFLFSALIILVGLIIKENQGLNELESIESESRYSQIFEGWIDQSVDDHDDHSPEVQESHEDDEREEDEDDDETYSESEQNNTEGDNEEEDQSQSIEEYDTTETEEDSSTPRSEEDTEEDTVLSAEVSEEDEGSQEVDQNSKEAEEEEESKEENDRSDQLRSLERGETASAESVEHEEAASEEKDEEDEPKEEREAGAPDLEEQKPSSGVAKKIFVGLALLTVAYNVFLRKRRPDVIEKPSKSSSSEGLEECPPDLSRRNTIIPPPTLQEVELDLPDVEIEPEEYSEDDYSDEDSHSEHRTAREEYQDLRKTYTRSLSPEGDFEVKDKHYEDDVLEDGEEHEGEELEDDFENYDQDEDEELLKRLEAKYGKLGRDVNVGDEGNSDREVYEHSDITNKDDYEIREDIDAALEQLDKNAAYANKMFEALLDQYPLSPRLLYGKAKALDNLAEEQQSNDLLSEALTYYLRALNTPSVPNRLYIQIADRYINRARFIGQYKKAIAVHWQLIERFPENSSFLNTLAVTYLTVNLVEEARSVLQRVLSKWPDDGFALVHYGFILKTVDNDLKASVDYLSRGLKKRSPGVINGRFYFHLGDALARLGKNDEAVKIYEEGVEQKVFMSRYQRSLYNVDRLTAKPWWEFKDLATYEKLFLALTDNWKEIRREGLSALSDRGYFEDEAENLKDTGTWKQLELFARGQKHSKNCAKTPITCSIIQRFPYASGCRRGQTKFSVMHPGTHVWPHCGPTNCRLRVHLGLKVPPDTFIRVAEEIRSWKEGDIFIFDDSFEHEVWHNGSDFRLVLIIDIWHPELTLTEKRSLSPI